MTPFVNTDLENIYDKITEGNLSNEAVLSAIKAYNLDTLFYNFWTLTKVPVNALSNSAKALLNGLTAYNPNAYPVYVKFFGVAAENVILGTTVPIYKIMVPALGQVVLDSTSIYCAANNISLAVTKNYLNTDTADVLVPVEVSLKMN